MGSPTALLCQVCFLFLKHCRDVISDFIISDNADLLDLQYLLDVQAGSANGTYVANNPSLCVAAPISWSQQTDSLISYEFGAV